jgi:hypothetical protein
MGIPPPRVPTDEQKSQSEKSKGTTMAEQKEETAPKRKKINALTLAEIEAKLAECQEKQGGLISRYAQKLLARKKVLSG